VLYRVEIGVCLASGDPIGDRDSWPAAIAAWQRIAEDHGWSQAVMGSSEAGAHAYERAGLTAIQLGDEAIIETHGFTLRGPDMHVVRQAVRRVERLGFTARIRRHGSVGADDMAQVIECAERWRGDETERGFSMALGRLGDPADNACVLVEALDADGELRALLSFVPWGPTGLSLDLMRRDPTAPNGVIELMVSELTRRGPELSVMRVSLNFAVFRAAFEEGNRIGAGPILRAWRRLLILLSRWWQLEALYRSNVKFSPTWNARFLCYADARMLARIGVASGMAEGFLTVPSWLRSTKGIAPPGLSEAQLDQITADLRAETARAQADPLPLARCRTRHAKLSSLASHDMHPYPAASGKPRSIAGSLAGDEPIEVSGRIVHLRDHGGVVFIDLRDWTDEVQVVLTRDAMPSGMFDAFRRTCDTGDLIDLTGAPARTETGHLSLFASSWRMSAKSLHPPEPGGPATGADAIDLVRTRSAVIRSLRTAMEGQGFSEVETPILQRVHGGANARPFATHLTAYDLDLTLRIAPELYLKRLCVGGLERVFEIGRVFRNEGIDRRHHPEFTSLEAYQAHADYVDMRGLCRALIIDAATAAHGDAVALHPVHGTCDLTVDWPVITVHEAVSAAVEETVDLDTPVSLLTKLCDVHSIPVPGTDDPGRLVVELYEALVEPHTTMPTFYTDFPSTVCPLTRSKDTVPAIAERWDLVAFGMEIATAYSELTDPIEQRRRLRAQSLLAAGGDDEAMEIDEEFLAALERGMPPTGGLGLGVDRLLMMLTGRPIRDVVTFPLTRGQSQGLW
jgi:lysyl-tRNA synthetase class 2